LPESEKTKKVLDLKDKLENVFGDNINNLNLTDPQMLGDSFMATQIAQLDDKSLENNTKQKLSKITYL
jgi:hypothetical protein